ncbi:hypothetical protein [Georgenia sp. SUBG003]|uniref:hypothetical protein n=1 Tax=Georgenia sp. SUBG003 TaxID=1497974 RepID=UPI0004DAB97A|nr:hypothetical protein DA06_21575 [Georgenia sp. SUBG003]
MIAQAALQAELSAPAGADRDPTARSASPDAVSVRPAGAVASATTVVPLIYDVAAPGRLRSEVAQWNALRDTADPATAALLTSWIEWAEQRRLAPEPEPYGARVTALRWGSAVVLALPGEPFAAAAHAVRGAVDQMVPGAVTVVAGYSDGCPGYLPTREEYELGGYEVVDAHRYYGAPGPFARGSLEAVVRAAEGLVRELT